MQDGGLKLIWDYYLSHPACDVSGLWLNWRSKKVIMPCDYKSDTLITCYKPLRRGQRYPPKSLDRWSECHFIITGHDYVATLHKLQCTNITSRTALKYHSYTGLRLLILTNYTNHSLLFQNIHGTAVEAKWAPIWLIGNTFWSYICQIEVQFDRESDGISSFSLWLLVLQLSLKNYLFTNPFTDDIHIRAVSSVAFSQ